MAFTYNVIYMYNFLRSLSRYLPFTAILIIILHLYIFAFIVHLSNLLFLSIQIGTIKFILLRPSWGKQHCSALATGVGGDVLEHARQFPVRCIDFQDTSVSPVPEIPENNL